VLKIVKEVAAASIWVLILIVYFISWEKWASRKKVLTIQDPSTLSAIFCNLQHVSSGDRGCKLSFSQSTETGTREETAKQSIRVHCFSNQLNSGALACCNIVNLGSYAQETNHDCHHQYGPGKWQALMGTIAPLVFRPNDN
jgi:hypothetical protein